MNSVKKQPVITGPTNGKNISVAGNNYRILISGEETNGAFATIDMIVPPGGGPGPHAHADINESFYVMDGEIEVKSEFGTTIATKGTFVTIPKGGVVHAFKNISENNAHLLCIVVPAGLDSFFMEIGTPVDFGQVIPPAQLTPEAVSKLQKIAEKYGQEIYPPDFLDNV